MAVRNDGEEEGRALDPEDPLGEEAQNPEEEIAEVEAPEVEDAEEEENGVGPGIVAEQEENPGEQAAQLAELERQMNDRRTELMAIAEQAQLEHQAMEAEAERLHDELDLAIEAFENAEGDEDIRNAEIEKNRLENNLGEQKNLIQQNLVNVQMAVAVATPPKGNLQLGEQWFEDLDASSLDCFGCLFELMDNSIFHAEEHVPMNIEINVHMKENQQQGDLVEKIEIIDNGCGIDSTIIFAALSPWGRKGENDEDNPSEHGMGMKYGISGLGKNFTLETKTRRDTHSKIVTQETCKLMVRHIAQNLGPVVLEENIVTWDHGTRITITNCNEKGHELGFKVSAADTLRDAALEISNRYRRYIPNKLHPDNFSIKRIDYQGNVIFDYSLISGYKPIYYYNPFQDELKLPIIDRFPLEPEDGSNRWYATLTFGVAPSDIEWKTHFTEDEQQNRNRQYDLYKVKTSSGGFDVVYKDLVLQREYLTKDKLGGLPGIIKNHPSNNRLRGIIDLKRGFSSRTEKVGVKGDLHFRELSELIGKILAGKVEGPRQDPGHKSTWLKSENPKLIRYTKWLGGGKSYTERELEGGLVNRWEAQKDKGNKQRPGYPKFMTFRRQRKRDTGIPDIVINKDKWRPICVEVKSGEANGNDVYQLFKYMQEHNTKFGIIAAPEMSTGGEDALKQIHRLNRPSLFRWWFRPYFRKYKIEYFDTSLHNIVGDATIQDKHLEPQETESEET